MISLYAVLHISSGPTWFAYEDTGSDSSDTVPQCFGQSLAAIDRPRGDWLLIL